jgi:probable F420-dependent oxidoreductase
MQQAVQFGLAIPQAFGKEPVDVALVENFLKQADVLGYHSLWVQEVIDAALLEPVALLTYAAALTQRIRLGSAILLTALRSPLQVAKTLSSLDQLSRGRLIVGVGLGSNTEVYPGYGISTDKRLRRFLDGIDLLKALWTEEQVSRESEFWKLVDERVEPKPVQKPHPPLWFGGSHPNALRRAVKLGSGWLGGRTSTEKFRGQVAGVQRCLEEFKRDPADFMIGKRVYIAVDRDKTLAERKLNEWFNQVYGVGDIASSAAIYGGEQECVDKLGEIVTAGAKLLILNPISDHLEQQQSLAHNVLPKIDPAWDKSALREFPIVIGG